MADDGLTPTALLAAARALVDAPPTQVGGAWPRAAALLTRQALEAAVAAWLAPHISGGRASVTAQLVALRGLHPDEALTARVAFTWSALSEACHHHGYELPPTTSDLLTWMATVDALIADAALTDA
jgi:hypothetical protein